MKLRVYANTLVALVAGLLAIWVVLRSAPTPYGSWQWVGLALALLGLAGIVMSRWTLGSSQSLPSTITSQHRLLRR